MWVHSYTNINQLYDKDTVEEDDGRKREIDRSIDRYIEIDREIERDKDR